ncbi:hypothetical protein PPSIR1_20379 [Plesiocystis pacifica SIR-1]|uniref:Mechanosensitive ion channel MscS domain-containing protein n=1 Tax=Plesiocystis pacifica SIR-1 TaxID=391625 RepID=A6G252_9BACT|nr:mechanosensitive ion channel domain-containing protein [Plesiocystis pacifica]EDM80021.1 hypothetical protein PPSIR1_20379 [Plesiocystis pacifica SIR-1]
MLTTLALALANAPSVAPATPLGARIDGELEALLTIRPVALLTGWTFVFALAVALAVLGPLAVRTTWRLGFDVRHRLGYAASASRVLALGMVVLGVLRPFLSQAPTLGSAVVLLGVGMATIAAPTHLRNLGAGLALIPRTRLREGDLVTVGALEGTVRDIGLLRVSLRTGAGGITHVPAVDFDRLPIVVGSRRAAVPIAVSVPVPDDLAPATLARARRELWCSPYRRAGTELEIRHEASTGEGGKGRLSVRMDTWAATSSTEVEAHLLALLGRVLPDPVGKPGSASEEGSP